MLHESNRIEFKSILNDKMEKEIVAFLNNQEGGILYIGLDDDGHPTGCLDLDSIQLKVADRIKNNILPATLGLFDIVTEVVENVPVIKILISSGLEKPYYIKSQGMSPSGCYTRVGTSSQPMTVAMIDDLYARRIHTTLRNIVSPRQDLKFAQLKIYYQERGLALNDQFASSLELLTPEGKYNYIAYLLADENGTSIKVAKYAGTDRVDLIENEEYGYCSLIKATHRVLDKFKVENITKAKITDTVRIEKNLVEELPLREAITNAVVHNDYSREYTPVFEIFSDRIEIISYGGLIQGQSEEDFFSGGSMPRNRELMRIFRDVDLVEQLGSGMGRIMKVYGRSVFHISQHFIKVAFPLVQKSNNNKTSEQKQANKNKRTKASEQKQANKTSGQKKTKKTIDNMNKIRAFLESNGESKTSDIADHIKLSEPRTRAILSEMDDLDSTGVTNDRKYKIK